MSNFNSVYQVARERATNTINSELWAKQIVASAQGDARMAYDFLDMLNRHVTKLLQEKKG